jgi:hypothetical protein
MTQSEGCAQTLALESHVVRRPVSLRKEVSRVEGEQAFARCGRPGDLHRGARGRAEFLSHTLQPLSCKLTVYLRSSHARRSFREAQTVFSIQPILGASSHSPARRRENQKGGNKAMRTTFCSLTRCITSKWLFLFALALLAMGITARPASAQNCLSDEDPKLNAVGNPCQAGDVKVAKVVGIRDLNGNPLSTCFQGTTFSFLADFEIVTTSNSSRSNIGLYFATQGQASALSSGTCVDNIISPLHQCPGAATGIMCGSDNYHELDPAPDNCGDTSSTDSSPVFGTAAEGVTIVVNNFLCQAPAGSTTLQMANCTSWQVPGKQNLCVSNPTSFPYPAPPAATPGDTSKCSCAVLPLPITPVTATAIVQKACTTSITTGPATFTQNPNTQSPTSCNAGAEGSQVTYTVSITNTSSAGGISIDQICDSQYGNIFTATGFTPACPAGSSNITATNVSCPPGPLAAAGQSGSSGTCTFTATVGENVTGLTDIVSASGHSTLNTSSHFGPAQSNSVTVTSSDAPSTATTTKGFVGTEAGCATVRYSVDVKNTSTADEALSLSALTDTAYGDITKLGTGNPPKVLGTTCGVSTSSLGLGTLNGVAGAGALPTTIAVGGDYKCQFDGQFCSAVDVNTCISNVDSVSATLAGDESETVTQTENTLTVKECFAATVTSQP